jgi:hypothetical protein
MHFKPGPQLSDEAFALITNVKGVLESPSARSPMPPQSLSKIRQPRVAHTAIPHFEDRRMNVAAWRSDRLTQSEHRWQGENGTKEAKVE